MTDVPNLSSVHAKIERAKRHAADIEQDVARILDPGRYHFAFDPDIHNGEHVYRIYDVPKVDPAWTVVLGDCLHNLRSALDHLAWQLVLLDQGKPTDKTYFPIREVPFNEKGRLRSRVQTRPPIRRLDILDAIEQAQPYSGHDGRLVDPHDSPLWSLRCLSNIDKHRLLLVVACMSDWDRWWWASDESDPRPRIRGNVNPLKDGDPVAFFDFHGAPRPPDFDPNAALQIVIRERGTFRLFGRRSVSSSLAAMIWTVEWEIVNNRFASLFSNVRS